MLKDKLEIRPSGLHFYFIRTDQNKHVEWPLARHRSFERGGAKRRHEWSK